MWETWVQSLGCEDPLEEGMATHSSVLAWRISMDRGTQKADLRLRRQTIILMLVLTTRGVLTKSGYVS